MGNFQRQDKSILTCNPTLFEELFLFLIENE